jgi:hypothetical protein
MTCAGADDEFETVVNAIAGVLAKTRGRPAFNVAIAIGAALDAAGFAILRKPAGGALPPPRDDRGAWPTAAAQA